MTAIVVQLCRWDHRRLQRFMRKTREAGVRTRALIVLHAAAGKGTTAIAEAVGYDPSAVLKVLHRYRAEGEEGLRDHREDNGHAKVDDAMRAALAALVSRSPEDDGWARPTWTQELLARQLTRDTGARVSESTVARMLADLGARWGMARPTVACPWGKRAQTRRVRAIERRLARLPAGEEAFRLCGGAGVRLWGEGLEGLVSDNEEGSFVRRATEPEAGRHELPRCTKKSR